MHEVCTYVYVVIIAQAACSTTYVYTKVPVSDKNQVNTKLNITWVLIISGTYFITQCAYSKIVMPIEVPLRTIACNNFPKKGTPENTE